MPNPLDKLTSENPLNSVRNGNPLDVIASDKSYIPPSIEYKDPSQYEEGYLPIVSGDVEEYKAQHQSNLAKIANGTGRLVGTTLTKFGEGLGFIAGATDLAINGFDDISRMTDNSWVNAFKNFEEEQIKQNLPVYTPKSVSEGNLLDKMTSTSFWMDKGVDGSAFLLSTILGGGSVKALGLGAKATSAIGRGAKVAEGIDQAAIATFNTVSESAFEAKDVQESIIKALQPKVESGEMTLEEAEIKAADGAVHTFTTNMGLLLGPNLIQSKWLFGSFNKEKSLLGKVVDDNGNFIEAIGPISRSEITQELLKKSGTGIVMEGGEENIQNAIQNYETAIGEGTTDDNWLEGIGKGIVDGFSTAEGQEAMFLGAVMGAVGGGVGGVREAIQENTQKEKLAALMTNNIGLYKNKLKTSLQDLYEKDDQGNIKLDDQNNPVINQEKAAEATAAMLQSSQIQDIKKAAAISGNKDLFDYIKNDEFTGFALPFLQYEGGSQVLEKQIDNLAQEETQDAQQVDPSKPLEVNQIKSELKTKTKSLQKMWDNIYNKTSNWKFQGLNTKANDEVVASVQADLFLTASREEFLRNKIVEINQEIVPLQVIPENEKTSTDTERLETLLKKREDYNNEFKKKQQEYKDLLDKDKAQEEVTKGILKKEEEALEAERQEVIAKEEAKQAEVKEKEENKKTFDTAVEQIKQQPEFTDVPEEVVIQAAKEATGLTDEDILTPPQDEPKPTKVKIEKGEVPATPDLEIPDVQAEIKNYDLAASEERLVSTDDTDEGFKTSKVNIAYLSSEYERTASPTGSTIKVNKYTPEGVPVLNKEALLLSSPDVEVGETLVLFPDTNYKVGSETYESLRAKGEGYVPIAIAERKNPDVIIGYVHNEDWVSPESGNVAPSFQAEVEARTKAIRKRVLEAQAPVEAEITSKSIGYLITMQNKGLENNFGFVNSLTKSFGEQDPSKPNKFGDSELTISKNEITAFNGKNKEVNKSHNIMKDGIVYMKTPTPVKDVFFSAALNVDKTGRTGQSDVVVTAIEQYLNRGTNRNIDLNGHNIATIEGLSEFINEITLIGNGTLSRGGFPTIKTLNLRTAKGKLKLDYGTNPTFNEGSPFTPEIKQELKRVIDGKLLNVDKDLVTSTKPYSTYRVEGASLVVDTTYPNYAKYLEDRVLKSNVHSEIVNGQRIMFSQPNIGFDLKENVKKDKIVHQLENDLLKASPNDVISDKDFNIFIDTGNVSPKILSDIGVKIQNRIPLTQRENAIFAEKSFEIEAIVKDLQAKEVKKIKEESFPSRPEVINHPIVRMLEENGVKSAVEFVAGSNHRLSEYAKVLLTKNLDRIHSHIKEDPKSNEEGGQIGDEIFLNPSIILNTGELYRVLLEEVTHAILDNQVFSYESYKKDGNKRGLSDFEISTLDSIDALRGISKKQIKNPTKEDLYAFTSLQEFTARTMTNDRFQQKLNNIEFTKNTSILQRFRHLIMRLLGIDVTPGSILENSAYEVNKLLSKNLGFVPTIAVEGNYSKVFDKDIAKELGLVRKEVSGLQKNMRLKELGTYNAKNGTSYFIEFKRLGQSDVYTWEIFNLAKPKEQTEETQLKLNLSPKFEGTGDKNLDVYVQKWTDRKEALEKKKTTDPDKLSEIEREIEQLDRRINTLVGVEQIFDAAKIDLKGVEESFKSNISAEGLRKAETIINGWLGINKAFEFERGTEAHHQVAIIASQARSLRKEWMKIAKEYFTKEVNKIRPADKQLNIQEVFDALFDASTFDANLYDSSTSESIIEQVIDKWLKEADFDITAELNTKVKEIDDIFKGVKKSEIDQLLQKDSKGNKTGNLLDPYKKEYYDILEEKSKEANENSEKWGEYFDWLNKNSYIITTKEAIEDNSKNFSKQELAKQRELLQKFEQDFTKFKDSIEEKIKYKHEDDEGNIMSEEDYKNEIDEAIRDWRFKNSPYLREQYEQEVKNGTRKAPDMNGMEGYKYLLFPKPKNQWKDPAYDRMKANPKLAKIHKYFVDNIRENSLYIPNSGDPKESFLPDVKRTYFENIVENGTSAMFKGVGKRIIDGITVDEEEDRKLKPEEKSYDLEKVLKDYLHTATAYKYKGQIEDKVLLGRQLFDTIEEKTTGKKGTKSVVLKNYKDRLDYTIKSLLFGQRKNLQATDKFETGVFKDKRVSYAKLADTINQWTQAKGLGLNPFSGVTNLLFGKVANRLHAAAGTEFTDMELTKAEGLVSSSIYNKKNKEKIASLMTELQVIGEINQVAHGDKSVFDKLYVFQKYGELIVQSELMTAVLLHDKFVGKDGQQYSLWDGFNQDGTWNTEKYGDIPVNMKDLSGKVQQLSKNLHGNYQLNSPTRLKSGALGRMLLVFKNWIPNTVMNRIGKERFDTKLNRTFKGRYRTLFEMFSTKPSEAVKNLLKLSFLGKLTGNEVKNMSEVDKANLKTFLRELSYASSLYLLALVLRGMIEDGDDDKNKSTFTWFLNTATRIDQDLWFYASPEAFSQITKDPIAAVKTMRDFMGLFDATKDYVLGEDEIVSGRNKGKSKLARSIRKQFPVWGQVDRIKTLTELDLSELKSN